MLFNNLSFLRGLAFYTWFGFFLKICLATLFVTCLCNCGQSRDVSELQAHNCMTPESEPGSCAVWKNH